MYKVFTMDESITVRISGNSTSLTSTYSPVINVNGNSEIALVWLKTHNSGFTRDTENILINGSGNSMEILYNGYTLAIQIDPGIYNISQINSKICKTITDFAKDQPTYFSLTHANTHSKCRINCDQRINFGVANSLADTLGFEKKIYDKFTSKELYHQSNKINYYKSNHEYNSSIKVICNLVKGSFDNGQQSHSIYEFYPQESVKTEIVESPINLIYYKLKTAVIKKIKIDLVDEENKPIDNSNEKITVILHIRPIKS